MNARSVAHSFCAFFNMTMKHWEDIFTISSSSTTTIMPPDESPLGNSTSNSDGFPSASKPQQVGNNDSSIAMMYDSNPLRSNRQQWPQQLQREQSNTQEQQQQNQHQQEHRRVNWGVARLYPIAPLEEYSPERIRKTWYQPSEYAEISCENLQLISNLMQYGTCEEHDMCTARGLEHMTEEEIKRRKRLRDEAVDAVLDEQDRQHEQDHRLTPEPEGIARVYSPISLRAYRIARRWGSQDEKAAKDIAAENEISIQNKTKKHGDENTQHLRKVQFSSMARVQSGLHLNEYTAQEVLQCWYLEKDIQIFKGQSKKLIKSLLKSKIVLPNAGAEESILDSSTRDELLGTSQSPKPSSVCIRGLEPYLLSSKIGTRKDNVIKTWNAVLDEQDRQDTIHEFLPAHLAQASRDTSCQCGKVARKLAQQDERFVAKFLEKEIQEWGIQIPRKKSPPLQRRGSMSPSTDKPKRVPLDYRRDSLSVAGATSKTAKVEFADVPTSIITIMEAPLSCSTGTHRAPKSPHPLSSDMTRDRQELLNTLTNSVSFSSLEDANEEQERGVPAPSVSESSKRSTSSSESSSRGFNMLKAMSTAVNQPLSRTGHVLAQERKE